MNPSSRVALPALSGDELRVTRSSSPSSSRDSRPAPAICTAVCRQRNCSPGHGGFLAEPKGAGRAPGPRDRTVHRPGPPEPRALGKWGGEHGDSIFDLDQPEKRSSCPRRSRRRSTAGTRPVPPPLRQPPRSSPAATGSTAPAGGNSSSGTTGERMSTGAAAVLLPSSSSATRSSGSRTTSSRCSPRRSPMSPIEREAAGCRRTGPGARGRGCRPSPRRGRRRAR